MKRWLIHAFICCYLTALFGGVVSYALSLKLTSHPASYFFVWDMFCGWSAYESRVQIIGQGESGTFYRLGPGPWGEFCPFGELDRRHYDSFGFHAHRIAKNAVAQTTHEPMTRMFVIEEVWPKKFNVPDAIWYRRNDQPKDVHRYYNVRSVLDGEGNVVSSDQSWWTKQSMFAISDNPRLRTDSHRGKPFIAVNPANGGNLMDGSTYGYGPAAQQPATTLLGGN